MVLLKLFNHLRTIIEISSAESHVPYRSTSQPPSGPGSDQTQCKQSTRPVMGGKTHHILRAGNAFKSQNILNDIDGGVCRAHAEGHFVKPKYRVGAQTNRLVVPRLHQGKRGSLGIRKTQHGISDWRSVPPERNCGLIQALGPPVQ